MPTIRQQSEDDDTPWPEDGFTGEWIVQWPNGQIKFRSHFIGGKEEGPYFCYWANGKFAQKGTSSNGVCKGLWEDFREDGLKFKETYYDDSENFTERWIDEKGVVGRIQTFRNGMEQNPEKGA